MDAYVNRSVAWMLIGVIAMCAGLACSVPAYTSQQGLQEITRSKGLAAPRPSTGRFLKMAGSARPVR